MREQLEWQQQPFGHNQACLDLIAAKPHGILRILDDQCSFPQVRLRLLRFPMPWRAKEKRKGSGVFK